VTASTGDKIDLPPITRPNGKTYRPRRIVARPWENDDAQDNRCGAVVLGTHDIDLARPLAQRECTYRFGMAYAIKPDVDWFRDGFVYSERAWIRDEVRGSAGVMFTASDDPEETR
jgi:hypothetical protein